jgi:Zn-dependent M16 (insulinase) family peptidase
MQQAMYPGTTYENVSGGDPKSITDLTHEQLLDFHKRHYHPSNARFYTYGKNRIVYILHITFIDGLM